MEDVVNISDYFKFLLALGVVIGLILLLGFLLRRFGAGFNGVVSKGRRRLTIVEALPLDAKHRLVLVKRDEVEHLVILGHTSDTLIETAIIPPEELDDISDGKSPVENSGAPNTASQRFKDLLNSMKSNQQ